MPELEQTPIISSGEHKWWTCAECDTLFTKSKLLETHARQSRHKAYSCVVCNKAFNLRTAMVRHESSHSKPKKHTCSRCNYAFHRRDHCQDHEAVCGTRPATDSRTISRSRSASAKETTIEAQTVTAQATQNVSRGPNDEVMGAGALSTQPTAEVVTIDRNAWEASVRGRGLPKARSRHHASPSDLRRSSSAVATKSLHQAEIAQLEDSPPSVSSKSPEPTVKQPDGSQYDVCIQSCTYGGCNQRFLTRLGLHDHERYFHSSPSSRPSRNVDLEGVNSWPEKQQHSRTTTPPPLAQPHMVTLSGFLPAAILQQHPVLAAHGWNAMPSPPSTGKPDSRRSLSNSSDGRNFHVEWQGQDQGLDGSQQKLQGQHDGLYMDAFEGR